MKVKFLYLPEGLGLVVEEGDLGLSEETDCRISVVDGECLLILSDVAISLDIDLLDHLKTGRQTIFIYRSLPDNPIMRYDGLIDLDRDQVLKAIGILEFLQERSREAAD